MKVTTMEWRRLGCNRAGAIRTALETGNLVAQIFFSCGHLKYYSPLWPKKPFSYYATVQKDTNVKYMTG